MFKFAKPKHSVESKRPLYLYIISRKHVHEKYTPLEPYFYIAQLGYAGVYLFFLFLHQNIDCGYLSELPRQGSSN